MIYFTQQNNEKVLDIIELNNYFHILEYVKFICSLQLIVYDVIDIRDYYTHSDAIQKIKESILDE